MSGAPIVVVGAGLAGTRCAVALRRLLPQRGIMLVGDEPQPAYERPPLSKQYLAGTRDCGSLTLPGCEPEALAARGIELRLDTRVVRLDAAVVDLTDGTRVDAAAIVLATGARPRMITDAPTSRVHVLRSLADARQLRDALEPGLRLVIVGSGFVGAEVASTARDRGVLVTMIESEPRPFARTLGPVVGDWLLARWRDAEVDVRLGSAVAAIEELPGSVLVRLADGTRVDADHVLVAIGTVANDELFHAAWPGHGQPGQGIPVDANGHAPVPGVWAAGDVAATHTPTGMRRLEHWTDAAVTAERVARSIAGAAAPPATAPYAWSDQFGVRVQLAGHAGAGFTPIVDELGADSLLVRWLDDAGALRGVAGVGHPAYVAECRARLAA